MKYNVETRNHVKTKIEKYNQTLSRSLKTLEYIYMIENDYAKQQKKESYEELLEFKINIQENIIRITEKINYYKSLQKMLR
ncbi:hypothetical protein [Flavivirga eckloniae]|uniref:Uncharacterized protein n=1 Tax=Flavivirga eckloniae TaxID=1803846 RepID=A0A2K9PKD1_9FLAO|nr:hypothetical protein [Flavivirga eckloniae]AUP77523.1 hypothetical protein C1H87_01820 [Flavivirga eckloniae]